MNSIQTDNTEQVTRGLLKQAKVITTWNKEIFTHNLHWTYQELDIYVKNKRWWGHLSFDQSRTDTLFPVENWELIAFWKQKVNWEFFLKARIIKSMLKRFLLNS